MAKITLLTLALLGFGALGALRAESHHPSRWRRLRTISQAILIGASAVDIASSYNLPEANPLLRDPRTGLMLRRGVAIKAGILAALLISQDLPAWRRHPRAQTLLNLGSSAAIGAVAIRNLRLWPQGRQGQAMGATNYPKIPIDSPKFRE